MRGIEVPAELMSFLRTEEQRATDPALNDARATALEYYQGEPFGDEEVGRSAVVTRDVSEVIDQFTVGILGTMISGDRVVEFETETQQVPVTGPDGQPQIDQQSQQPVMETVDYGQEASESIAYLFLRGQGAKRGTPRGYRLLHDALKAGLLEKSGVVKTYVDHPAPKRQTLEVPGALIDVGPDGHSYQGMPVIQADAIDDGWQPGMQSENWRIVVEQTPPPFVRDEAIPNEYFLCAPDAVDLDEALYVGDRTPKTISDLIGMGFDPDLLSEIWGSLPPETVVENARDSDRSYSRQSIGSRSGLARAVWLNEEYPLWDMDGDGIAERVCVHRIGENVLSVVPVDRQPYTLWTPFPMQHRLIGQSAADKVMDIQRVRSVLLRQALDSLYLANAPRTTVNVESMTEDTIDDLLTVRPGALIRYKGAQAPAPLLSQDTSQQAFAAMETMSNERESRTGVTRQSQGMNPDTLNKTASGMAMLQAAADQVELYITRNFAELLIAPIFLSRYHLMREFVPPFKMKLDGKYVEIDPAKWPEDIDIKINVGLGTGNKDQIVQAGSQLLSVQREAMQGGLRLVGEKQIFNTMKKLIDATKFGVPSDYVLDPDTLPPAEPQPDPEAAKAQGEQQLAAQKEQNAHEQAMSRLQLQEQEQQANSVLKAQANEQDLAAKREKAALDSDLARAKAEEEARLAQQRQAFEEGLAERRFQFDQQMAQKKAQQASESDDSIPGYRPGGSLAE